MQDALSQISVSTQPLGSNPNKVGYKDYYWQHIPRRQFLLTMQDAVSQINALHINKKMPYLDNLEIINWLEPQKNKCQATAKINFWS